MSAALLERFDLLAGSVGGIAKLRELILSLAVRGRLVPQDPSDEPASELLKRIRAEKDRLIAEGKIKRDKPLAAIGEAEKPYELPEGWAWARWNEAALQIGDIDHKMPDEVQSGFPYISPKDFGPNNAIDYEGAKQISEQDFLSLSSKIKPDFGDLIYPRYGTIGNVRLVKSDRPFLASYSCAIIKTATGLVEPKFQFYFSISDMAQTQAAFATNKTTQPNVGLKSIRAFLMPLPPIAEQSRIVAKVEALMALCDRLEAGQGHAARVQGHWVEAALGQLAESADADEFRRHWQHLAAHFDTLFTTPASIDRLDATLLQLAVRGKLVPQDPTDEPASELLKQIRAEKDRLIAEGKIKRDKPLPPIADEEKPYELPEGWEWVRFGAATEISSGVTLGRKTPVKKPISLPYLRVANVQRWHLLLHEVKEVVIDESEIERFRLQDGDLLITEGGDWDKVGRTCIWRNHIDTCLHQNHVFKVRRVSRDWNPRWGEMYLNSADARSYFASSAKQTTNLASINMTQLKSCVFPLPPLAEQSRIVSQIEKLQALTAALKARLVAAQNKQAHLRDALIAEVC